MKKKAILRLVAVLVVVGGAVGAGFLYEAPPQEALGEETPFPPPGGVGVFNPEEIDENTPPEVVEEYKRAGLIDESGKPIPQPQLPTLTQEEEARAKEIALSDPGVQKLLEGKEYVIEAVGLIHDGELKIGALVVLRLDKSYWFDCDWPYAPYLGEGRYGAEKTYHLALWARMLDISVNLEEGRVVEINTTEC